MRSGAWLGALGIWVMAACHTTYTAEATHCDDWCEATHGFSCEYDPAACVSACEMQRREREHDCDARDSELMDCYLSTPGALDGLCIGDIFAGPCRTAHYAMADCEFGQPSGTNACSYLCSSAVLTVCPPQDEAGCTADCLALGEGLDACAAERDSLISCLDAAYVYCESDSESPAESVAYDKATLPCQSERARLEGCGQAALIDSAAGGAPNAH